MVRSYVILLCFCLSCSDVPDAAGPAAAPSREATTPAPAASPSPEAPAETDEEAASATSPEVAPDEPVVVDQTRDSILFGDVYMIESPGGGDEEDTPYTLLAAIPPQPQPSTAVTGRIQVHAGYWLVRVIRTLPSPFERASVVEAGVVREVRVTRARELHVQAEPTAHDEGPPQTWTFLGLELAGQDGGSVGVAGSAVIAHKLRREDLRRPASAELVALVRPHDDDLGWEDPVPAADFRTLEFPQRGFTVVVGSAAWIVRDQVVLHERFHGLPVVLIEAGPRTFFEMSAPSENWAASLDDFLPPSAACVVSDQSGSPLNVRAAPRGRVVDTLENGMHVRFVESRGSWRRLEGRGQAWVHESGLRCGSSL